MPYKKGKFTEYEQPKKKGPPVPKKGGAFARMIKKGKK